MIEFAQGHDLDDPATLDGSSMTKRTVAKGGICSIQLFPCFPIG